MRWKEKAASGSRRSSAWRRPSSVRGTSVLPVCRPDTLHSVGPCRTSTSRGRAAECPPAVGGLELVVVVLADELRQLDLVPVHRRLGLQPVPGLLALARL